MRDELLACLQRLLGKSGVGDAAITFQAREHLHQRFKKPYCLSQQAPYFPVPSELDDIHVERYQIIDACVKESLKLGGA